MSSRHLVDVELMGTIERFPSIIIANDNLLQLRKNLAQLYLESSRLKVLPVSVEPVLISGAAKEPGIPALVYRPQSAVSSAPAIVFLHGGGFVSGTATMAESQYLDTAVSLNCVLISVEYRLAPEVPFPGPVEDCYAALKWVHANAGALGIDQSRIALAGTSAGAGLAAATALLTRDRGEFHIVLQHLIAPMIDDRTVIRDLPDVIGEYVWTRANNHFGWKSYLGFEPGSEDVNAYAAPSRAEDLSNLPPAFIAVGALDLFMDEDIGYARRLILSGVTTELHVYPGSYHGFMSDLNARISKRAVYNSEQALRRALWD